MDIENIVYLLIGLGWLIASAYKKMNKSGQDAPASRKKPIRPYGSGESKEAPDFQEVFRRMLQGDMSMGKSFDEPSLDGEEEKRRSAFDGQETIDAVPEDFVQEEIKQDKQVKVKHKKRNHSVFKRGFDAREAFIYSEIMKRPDY